MKKDKTKELLLEQLKKTPIIELACQKCDVSRASLYRWKSEDKLFADAVENALIEGNALVNDVAESQLLTAIKNGNLTAIMFFLRNRDHRYNNKIELTGHIEHLQKRELTLEERGLIEKSLRLAMPQETALPQVLKSSNNQKINE